MSATIRDVAKMAQTSMAAVSSVLNGKSTHNIRVGEATRERIYAAAAQLNYTANPIARSLVTRKTQVLGLVFPYSRAFIDRNPFCTQVMAGVFEEAIRERYNLMLHTAIGDDWSGAASGDLLDPRVDGLILVLPPADSALVEHCQQQGFPCVSLMYQPQTQDVCVVNADELTSGRLAAEHLISLGHTRIAHFVGHPRIATSEPRKQGFLTALTAAGLETNPDWLVPAGFDWKNGYEATEHLLTIPSRYRPTAVFAANDLCAQGVLRCLETQGYSVPDDMAVVGCDDTWFATLMQPKLTSVSIPIFEMGMRATQMLIALIEGKEIGERQPILPVSLSVRESTEGTVLPSMQEAILSESLN